MIMKTVNMMMMMIFLLAMTTHLLMRKNGHDNDETSIDNDGEFDADDKGITWHFLLQSASHSPLWQVVQCSPVS